MLRYVLLAGAAALALPGASLAQVQWSQPLPGENSASSVMDNPGVLDSPTDYDIPFNQAPTGFNADSYATAQQDAEVRSQAAYVPDASEDTTSAQSQQSGDGVYGGQPSGGYYFGNQGEQPMASADQGAYDQGANGAPPQDYGSPSYQGYGGGGAYGGQPAGPRSYVGQGTGSYESSTTGQGLGGEGAYQSGQVYGSAPANQGYGNQGYGGGGYYTGQQGAVANQPYASPPTGAYGAPPAP
jgi:hypothetical protein